MQQSHIYDVTIIGAGAAGLMCAIEAGKRGRRVVVIDHAKAVGEKIRISGGGRCNFTNLHASPKNYLSNNPHFCKSALSRYTQADFIALVESHKIAYHEKTLGQLFCDNSAKEIIRMLLDECARYGVIIRTETRVEQVEKPEAFRISTSGGIYESASLVVACGGLSIPKMGATDLGYRIAKQFNLPIVPTRAGLVPFVLGGDEMAYINGLSGIAVDAVVSANKTQFREGMLFTHKGLSGPSILQISSYWKDGDSLRINMAADTDMRAALLALKQTNPKQEIGTALGQYLPKRVVERIIERHVRSDAYRLADMPNAVLERIAHAVNDWQLVPIDTEGYRTAEVTLGGVDTSALSSKTMQTNTVEGLYFIGEVVDVTGHLGGFNFQWAWSSGFVAGQHA